MIFINTLLSSVSQRLSGLTLSFSSVYAAWFRFLWQRFPKGCIQRKEVVTTQLLSKMDRGTS